MAKSRVFQNNTVTIFGGSPLSGYSAKQAHRAITMSYLDIRSLYRFLLTSTECYQIAIDQFRLAYHHLFLKAVVTRNDTMFVPMLENDATLFSVCKEVEDYSYRQFVLPAFIYCLFTWDERALELMLGAIAKSAQDEETALNVVNELLRQMNEWEEGGVTYQCRGQKYEGQSFYDPTELGLALDFYDTNYDLWDNDQLSAYICKSVSPLQALMPVHLVACLASEQTQKPLQNMDDDKFENPVYVQAEDFSFLTFYPQGGKLAEYAVTSGVHMPKARNIPFPASVAATREVIMDRFERREQIVANARAKLVSYQGNPAILFAAESQNKKRRELPRPDFRTSKCCVML